MRLGPDPDRWPEPWRTEWHERAAIREHDGGQPRPDAERDAEDETTSSPTHTTGAHVSTTQDDLSRADAALARREPGSLTFRSVEAALEWYFRSEPRFLQGSAVSRTLYKTATGETCVVDVDGQGRGDFEGPMVTRATIGRLLERLPEFATAAAGERRGRPSRIGVEEYPFIVRARFGGIAGHRPESCYDGTNQRKAEGAPWSQVDIAKHYGVDQSTAARHLGRAVGLLVRVMRDGGVVR